MPTSREPIPTSWTQYEAGGRRGSNESSTSHVHFPVDDVIPEEREAHHSDNFSQQVRRRRSSVSMRISTIRHAGGVNSIDNFARSWTRAARFTAMAPVVRPSFRFADADGTDTESPYSPYSPGDVEAPTPEEHRSLLRHALQTEGRRPSDNAIDEAEHAPTKDVHAPTEDGTLRWRPRGESAFHVEPQLQSIFGGSYGTSYGSISGHMPAPSLRRATLVARPQITPDQPVSEDGEQEPLLIKQVEESDGHIVNVVVGQSTLPQTIFNSVNVLIGVGILALPLALRYSGWAVGLVFLIWAAMVTSYTARVLAKCLDVDSSLITFADLALVSFGPKARIFVSLLFSIELLGACVALVVLFADSLDALVPGIGLTQWKLICGVLLVPLAFMPLRLLSFSSVLGILSCTAIVLAVLVDGIIKPNAPGSLRSPMPTYLFPENWKTIPISLGLLMSPWGGHGVFPNIYRDMRHPFKYGRAIDVTYAITSGLDIFMAVIGVLMFGDSVRDEITSNILLEKSDGGYPAWLSVIICVCVAVIPLTKIPLNARPIVSTIEIMSGLIDPRAPPPANASWLSARGLGQAGIRIFTTGLFVLFAILLPSFDTIMSLMGSVACFSICIILPIAFHLKLFKDELSRTEKMANWALLIISTMLAIVSTAFNFIPKEQLGME